MTENHYFVQNGGGSLFGKNTNGGERHFTVTRKDKKSVQTVLL
jgi:hypothetical protein